MGTRFCINPVNDVLTTAHHHHTQILDSFFDNITNVQAAASVPAIELPPSKRRKLGRHEPLDGILTQSLARIVQEVVLLSEALIRIKEVLDMQNKISSFDL